MVFSLYIIRNHFMYIFRLFYCNIFPLDFIFLLGFPIIKNVCLFLLSSVKYNLKKEKIIEYSVNNGKGFNSLFKKIFYQFNVRSSLF